MPNIEVVLGLIGSTIGVMINVMFPSMFLVRVANKSPKEQFWARVSVQTFVLKNNNYFLLINIYLKFVLIIIMLFSVRIFCRYFYYGNGNFCQYLCHSTITLIYENS